MVPFRLPRVVVAGLSGSTGKTFVAAGLLRALARNGHRVSGFKKGPDFIDAAWLGAASGGVARNLDTFLMGKASILESLARAATDSLAVIEGNRGLFDGLDARGSHSTAELARQVDAPIVLVVDVGKCTRTVAAMVLGCLALEPDLPLGGIILNRVGTSRQETVIRDALALVTDVPVMGTLPRLSRELLPSRHLGLVMPVERSDVERALEEMADTISRSIDIAAIQRLAEDAPLLGGRGPRDAVADQGEAAAQAGDASVGGEHPGEPVRIGVLRDEAFSFYYAENLEALEAAGAILVPISPLGDTALPQIDALYAGGGYPEVYASRLSANVALRGALGARIAEGLPVWAECGGLMYLATELVCGESRYPMVGALPIAVEQTKRSQGHGYVEAVVDTDNPFLAKGTRLRGHEFHYSKLAAPCPTRTTVLALERGTGIGCGRDGIAVGSVFASYMHLLASGSPFWAPALVRQARRARAHQSLEGESHGQYLSGRSSDRGRRGRVHPGA